MTMDQEQISLGRDPRLIHIPGHGVISADDWVYDKIYDTVQKSAAAIAIGTQDEVFVDMTGKDLRQTNMTLNNQLPKGWQMIVMNIGIQTVVTGDYAGITTADLPEDAHNIYDALDFTFTLGKGKVVTEGRLSDYPFNSGSVATPVVDNLAAATVYFGQSNGVANGYQQDLRVPIYIPELTNYKGLLRWEVGPTLNEPWDIRVILTGYISRSAFY